MNRNKLLTTRNLVLIAVLGAVSTVLMLFQIPVPFAPTFYKLDIGDLPALIGSFAINPVAGILIAFIKNLLHIVIKGSDTMLVGEVANFIGSAFLILPAGLIYQHKKTKKSAILGLIVGTIATTIVSCFVNAFVTIPMYCSAFGMNMDAIVGMGTAINHSITNLFTFVVFAVAPFNIVKHLVTSTVVILIYKHVANFIHSYQDR